ncbi:hypothetical protein [Flectobacillus roseus]|uniref:hypothetical protein n=1 Tax=Flectobacillus roseus TaxID=502259 RepID=UPI0024B7C450|nr:hypothetical protein [Flectobacillus roseus]MDI9872079.1 hypothetical protein [Flectobacillus roseus]
MFIGHFAVGFSVKAIQPRISLGTLFLSVQFLDLLWPTLLQLGLEKVEIRAGITAFNPLDFIYYPISHSLIMALVWSALLGGIAMVFYQNLSIAVTLGLCVLSHWILDLIVHIPDLPIYWGKNTPKVGLGLWNQVWLTMALEFLLLVLGLFQYIKTTVAKNWMGIVGLWGLVGLLILIQIGNVLGPIPQHVEDIAWGAQLQWILIVWAYWVDSNRQIDVV